MFRNKLNLRNVVAMTICLAGMAFFFSCDSDKNKMIKVTFEGKKYDNLYLSANTGGSEKLTIDGASTDGYNWTFEIPDSVSEVVRHYMIWHRNDSLMNENESNVHMINFLSIINNDTLKGSYFNFDENETIIELKGKLDATDVFDNKLYIPESDTTIIIQTIITDHFLTELPENRYLREFMQTPMFGFFYDKENPNKSYEEFLVDYANKIKENPNSVYYISFFSTTPHFYKSKKDYENLYNLFSSEMKNSRWGKMAKMNFATVKLDGINDVVLPNPLTKETEKIILEPTKYTLLCFSASWCGPCHKKIPLMKEIHEKTKENLNLVYISTDESETIDNWNALMENENIKWRSLWLTDKKMKSDWQISSIPDFILVYPDGNAKKILLNEEKDIQELYLMVNE